MPSKQAEVNAVLRRNAETDKFHWKWYTVELQGIVRSYITGKAGRIPRRKDKRGLSDWPLYQPFFFVVVKPEKLFWFRSCCRIAVPSYHKRTERP